MNYLRVELRNIHTFCRDIYKLQLVFERIQLWLESFQYLALAVYFVLSLGLQSRLSCFVLNIKLICLSVHKHLYVYVYILNNGKKYFKYSVFHVNTGKQLYNLSMITTPF